MRIDLRPCSFSAARQWAMTFPSVSGQMAVHAIQHLWKHFRLSLRPLAEDQDLITL